MKTSHDAARRQNTLAHIHTAIQCTVPIKCDVFYNIERRSGSGYMRVTSVRLTQNGHTPHNHIEMCGEPTSQNFLLISLSLLLLFRWSCGCVSFFVVYQRSCVRNRLCESVYFYSRGKSLDGKLMCKCMRLAESRAAMNRVDSKRPVFVTRTLNRYKYENESWWG